MTGAVTITRKTAVAVLAALAVFASFTFAALREWWGKEPACVASVTFDAGDGVRTTLCTCRDGEECSKP